MNITKILKDEYGFSKYRISKLVEVSWITVHYWYIGLYKPRKAHLNALQEILEGCHENQKNRMEETSRLE